MAKYLVCNHMMSAALKRSVNRPVSPEELLQVHTLRLTGWYYNPQLEFKRTQNDELRVESVPLKDISLIDSLQDFGGIKTLWVELDQLMQDSKIPRILQQMGRLPHVEDLTLCSASNNRSALCMQMKLISEWSDLFRNLKNLSIKGSCTAFLECVPAQMDSVKNLVVEPQISLNTLLSWNIPELKVLHLHNVDGLTSIQQLTDHFPKLEKLIIGSKDQFYQNAPLSLGNVSPTLFYLDCSICGLEDPQALVKSGITNLCLRGCMLDPTPLQQCVQLEALEMQNCILTQPMPDLTNCKGLHYLVLNDCQLTDLNFAENLTELQVFNVLNNPLAAIKCPEPGSLPAPIAFLEKMPKLMEIVMDPKYIDEIMRWSNPLSDNWHIAGKDMLAPIEE